jgi:hypothetical protein
MNVLRLTLAESTSYFCLSALILCLLSGCAHAPQTECPEPAKPPPQLLEPLKPTTLKRMREIVTSDRRSKPSPSMQRST